MEVSVHNQETPRQGGIAERYRREAVHGGKKVAEQAGDDQGSVFLLYFIQATLDE